MRQPVLSLTTLPAPPAKAGIDHPMRRTSMPDRGARIARSHAPAARAWRAMTAGGRRLRQARRAAAAFVALSWLGGACAADLLYRQEPANDDAFLGSSWHAPDGSEQDQFVWDDFRLDRAATLSEIRWQGGYAPGVESAPVDGFTLSLFASGEGDTQPDLRGAALALFSVTGNAGETAVGTAGGAQLFDYRYTLAKPFVVKAGTTYWLQIEASQRSTPTWGLARAMSGNDRHFRKLSTGSDAYFQTAQGDAAFELSGKAAADRPAAPAPAPAPPTAPATAPSTPGSPPAQASPR